MRVQKKLLHFMMRPMWYSLLIILNIGFVAVFFLLKQHASWQHVVGIAQEDENVNVNIFNMSGQLEPSHVYERIECRRSARFVVTTQLCLYNTSSDMFVSASIWQTGAWEAHILSMIIKISNNEQKHKQT